MASPKEAEPGFYQFKSKTGGYTMLFPKNSRISSKIGFEQKKNSYETYIFEQTYKDSNFETQITYEDRPITQVINPNLDLLSSMVSYNGTYQVMHENNKTIYYAKEDGEEQKISYQYFSYIKANDAHKGISFISSYICRKESDSCGKNKAEYEKFVLKLMKSVRFSK